MHFTSYGKGRFQVAQTDEASPSGSVKRKQILIVCNAAPMNVFYELRQMFYNFSDYLRAKEKLPINLHVIAPKFQVSLPELAKSIEHYIDDKDIEGVVFANDLLTQFLAGDTAYQHLNYIIPPDSAKNRALKLPTNPYENIPVVYTVPSHHWLRTGGDVKSEGAGVNLLGYVLHAIKFLALGYTEVDISYLHDTKRYPVKPTVIRTIEAFDQLIKKLKRAKYVAIDSEGRNLNRVRNTVFTLQFCIAPDAQQGQNLFVLPIEHAETPWSGKELQYIKKRLRSWLTTANRNKYHIYHNAKFDLIQWINQFDVQWFATPTYDTIAGAFSLDENTKFLKSLGIKGYSLDMLEMRAGFTRPSELVISKEDRGNMAQFSLEDIAKYGAYDVLTVYHLCLQQIKAAKKRNYQGWARFVTQQIGAMIVVFSFMEARGVLVDRAYLEQLASPVGPLADRIKKVIDDLYATKEVQRANKILLKQRSNVVQGGGLFSDKKDPFIFSINNAESLQVLFFNVLELDPLRERKHGGGSIDKKFQKKYKDTVKHVKLYSMYNALLKLKSAFADSILKTLTASEDALADGRIRNMYWFVTVLTGRSCFVGDTPIYVLDEREKVAIKDIKPGDWVWSYNHELKKPEPKQVIDAWCAGKRETVKLKYTWYKNGRKRIKSVECTPDHKFLLANGVYREAQHLRPDDRLLYLERTNSSDGYRKLHFTNKKKLIGRYELKEHRYVVNEFDPTMHVHHKDEVRNNNVPSNLQSVTHGEHSTIHSRVINKYSKGEVIACLKKHNSRLTKVCKELCGDYNTLIKLLQHHGIDVQKHVNRSRGVKKILTEIQLAKGGRLLDAGLKVPEISRRLKISRSSFNTQFFGDFRHSLKNGGRRGSYMLDRARTFSRYVDAADYLGLSIKKTKRLLQDDNHVVISVTKTKTKKLVYDITVDGNHNFYANGVGAKNSATDPNMQQIPAKGDDAKMIKLQFIATLNKGKIFIKPDFSAHEIRVTGIVSGDKTIKKTFAIANEAIRNLRIAGDNYIEEARLEYKKNGDIHILNVRFFYDGKEVDAEHPLRQDVKITVFQTIYGAQAPSLGKQINKSTEEAQALMDKLFAAWPQAKAYMDDVQKIGSKNLRVFSPIQRPRHLWAYLHPDKFVHFAMNRRGPNSVVQGLASDIGYAASYCIQREIYHTFILPKLKFDGQLLIMVHDSMTNEVSLRFAPVMMYLLEHGMTTLVQRRMEEVFKFKIDIPFGFDMKMGLSEGNLMTWSEMRVSAAEKNFREMAKAGTSAHREQLSDALFNLERIWSVRRRELENDPYEMRLEGRTDWYRDKIRGMV